MLFKNRLIKPLFWFILATSCSHSFAYAAPQYARAWSWASNQNASIGVPYQAIQQYSNSSGFTRNDSYPYRNNYGGNTYITRLATGYYKVLFENIQTTGGTAHVTAYGGNHHCKIQSWYPSSEGENVFIKCFSPSGVAVNGRFSTIFYKDSHKGDYYADAYLWGNQPTTNFYIPSLTYQANSSNLTNEVRRTSTGKYQITIPGMNISSSVNIGGTVMVTAYGSGSEYCKVQRWAFSGTSLNASVNCFNSSGTAADSQYTFSFMKGITNGISVAEDQLQGAYVWANTSTLPNSYYQSSYSGNPIERHDLSTGRYRVEIPGLQTYNFASSNVNVTAYGNDNKRCNIDSWGNSYVYGNGTAIHVSCYNSAGIHDNSIFTLQFFTSQAILF